MLNWAAELICMAMEGLQKEVSMATAQTRPDPKGSPTANGPPIGNGSTQYHRVKTVRRQQGVSLRSAARQMGTDIRQTRALEDETSDLKLSDLYRWQRALGVPVTELLVESDAPLSRPVMERARMIRLMKTTAAILERSPTPAIQRMAQMLVEQLVEIMPELAEVTPWHAIGQRRSLDDLGRVVERRISDEIFSQSYWAE